MGWSSIELAYCKVLRSLWSCLEEPLRLSDCASLTGSTRLVFTEIGLDLWSLLLSILERWMVAKLLLKSLIKPVLLFCKVADWRSLSNWFTTEAEFEAFVESCLVLRVRSEKRAKGSVIWALALVTRPLRLGLGSGRGCMSRSEWVLLIKMVLAMVLFLFWTLSPLASLNL